MTTPSFTDRGWWVYQGTGRPAGAECVQLPDPPPWREFDGRPPKGHAWLEPPPPRDQASKRRLGQYTSSDPVQFERETLDLINAALLLRRPLLVTGKAGAGKSTLAHSIAAELQLGEVLYWPITSRSTLVDGLYQYDAIGRLQQVSIERNRRGPAPVQQPATGQAAGIGRFLRLGPLGTALLPWRRPRVLLIDEIDKSDIDLPNDLLTLFEEGEFSIPELARLPGDTPVEVTVHGGSGTAPVVCGVVRCHQFPIVVLTSNGERDFPPPFLRRCIRMELKELKRELLEKIIEAHLGQAELVLADQHITAFTDKQKDGAELAADQLLNAVYLASAGRRDPAANVQGAIDALLSPLNVDQ